MATAAERETVVQFDDASDYAVVYTHHERWKTRLRRIGAVSLGENGHGGETFHLPKGWVRLPSRPRVLSEAQRRVISRAGAASKRRKSKNE